MDQFTLESDREPGTQAEREVRYPIRNADHVTFPRHEAVPKETAQPFGAGKGAAAVCSSGES